uniref:DNA-directed DNA polymerase n=1 Tax=viral metagenome TaxID=1070528 RepID=A0A6C0JB19_9ZZZZ
MFIKSFSWSKLNNPLRFIINGIDENNKKVRIFVNDFVNHIYLKINDEDWSNDKDIQKDIREKIINHLVDKGVDVVKAVTCKRRTFYGHIDTHCIKVYIKTSVYKLDNLKNKPIPYIVVNGDIDERVKLATERNLKFCDWIEISDNDIKQINNEFIQVSYKNLHYPEDEDFEKLNAITPRYTHFYFDIECESLGNEEDEYEEDYNEVYDDNKSNDNIIMISCIVYDTNKKLTNYLLTSYEVDEKYILDETNINNVVIVKCMSEKDLMYNFFELLNDIDPDIVSGYNILEFDWDKILSVTQKYNISESIYKKMFNKIYGSIGSCYNRVVQKTWASNAFSTKTFHYMERIGSNNLDIIQYVKRNYNLPSYSLKNVTKKYLDEKWSKLDVDYKVIKLISMLCRESNLSKSLEEFKLVYQKIKPYTYFDIINDVYNEFELCQTLADVKHALIKPCSIIGKYCIVDSLLCFHLNNVLQINLACEEISNVSNIPLEDVIVRGTMHRTLCLLYKSCEKRNIILDRPLGKFEKHNSDLKGAISGALVLEPDVGYWNGVVTLDFASLYPNIIINYNLCATTLRFEPSKTTREIICANGDTYYFEQSFEGILPQIMKQMLSKRKEVKTRMKNTDKNTFLYSLLDCRQLALKVTANSGYGFTAAINGSRAIAPVAICTTSKGRDLLNIVKDILTQKGGRVIYGDTDSNLVIMPIEKPLESFNSELCVESMLAHDPELFEQVTPKIVTLKQDDQDNVLTEKYGINVIAKKGDALNISAITEKQIEEKSIKMAKYITDEINRTNNTDFDLEYESVYEHYILFKKKHYIGRSYANKKGTTKTTQKGVLPVKRLYSVTEKNIYNNTITAFFERKNILDVYSEQCIGIFTKTNINNYINTIMFKTLKDYADKKLTNIYIDKDKKNFTTIKEIDDRFVFSRRPVNVAIALQMIARNDIPPRYDRLEYVFYESKFGHYNKSDKKGDFCIDYEYFYRNSQTLYIKKIEYLKRLTNSINNVVELCHQKTHKLKLYHICTTLAKFFGIRVPDIDQCIKLTETIPSVVDKQCGCNDVDCQCNCSNPDVCECKCDCNYDQMDCLGRKIKLKKKQLDKENRKILVEELNLNISNLDDENFRTLFPSELIVTKVKPNTFIAKIRSKSLDYLRQTHVDSDITTLCSSINSYFVMENIFSGPLRMFTCLLQNDGEKSLIFHDKYYNKQCYSRALNPLKEHKCGEKSSIFPDNKECILFNNCLCKLSNIECKNNETCIKPVTQIAKKIKNIVDGLELAHCKKVYKNNVAKEYQRYYSNHYLKKSITKSSQNVLFFAKKRSTSKLTEADKIIDYIINKNSFVNQLKYM